MLIELIIENYKSFKDKVVFSMAASNDTEHLSSVSKTKRIDILKTAAVYGPNAGGKSNLLKATSFMKDMFLRFSRTSFVNDEIPVDSFKLDRKSQDESSMFEVTFLKNDVQYRYGFSLTSEKVEAEWFFAAFSAKESLVFTRENEKYDVGSSAKFNGLKKLAKSYTKSNSLFAAFVNQNIEIDAFKDLLDWFTKLHDITVLSNHNIPVPTGQMISKDQKFKQLVMKAIQMSDFSILDLEYEEEQINKNDDNSGFRVNISSKHNVFENEEIVGDVTFSFDKMESQGTKKFFSIIGPFLKTLQDGGVLIIDEFDSKLHPNLMMKLFDLFNDSDINCCDAQLIFSTHNTLFLDKDILRRDQIWFVQRDSFGVSNISSLYDFKVRKDASFDKDYLLGKMGYVPKIGSLKSLLVK